MFGRLHIVERGRPDRVVELTGTATIGRTADNDIMLESDGVSQVHAMFLAQDAGVMLVDLGSAFGTLVDTIPAEPDEPVPLVDGARIDIGRAAIHYAAPKIVAETSHSSASHPPRLAKHYLNTRFSVAPDKPIRVGETVQLRIWVGAPLRADLYQSSRPLEWSSLDLAPTALRVRVRAASPAWRVAAVEPLLLATSWGSAQVARYDITAVESSRTKLGIRIDHDETHSMVQYVRLGLSAVHPNGQIKTHTPASEGRCPQCGASIRAGARFCTHCGMKLM